MKNNIAPSARRPVPSKKAAVGWAEPREAHQKVGTQNETRESTMFTNKEEMKATAGAVSTAMAGLEGIAAKAAPTVLLALAALLLTGPIYAQTVETVDVPPNLGNRNNAGTFSETVLDCSSPDIDCGAADEVVVNVDPDGRVFGGFDFTGTDAAITINNAGDGAGGNNNATGWRFREQATVFGGGNVTIDNSGFMATSQSFPSSSDPSEIVNLVTTTVDFGNGVNRFNNMGTFVVGEGSEESTGVVSLPVASTTTFESLDEFNNTGLIVLGAVGRANPGRYVAAGEMFRGDISGGTDGTTEYFQSAGSGGLLVNVGRIDDVLRMQGTHFDGQAGSTLLLDAVMSFGRAQRNCGDVRSAVPANLLPGDQILPGADCMDLRGGNTEGSTDVIVRDIFPNDLGAPNPDGIVIIDVQGGDSDAAHFTLSPDSDGYDPALDAIDKGMFFYPLVFDPSTQQHKLVSLPNAETLQLPLLVQALQETSRRATNAWFQRRSYRGHAASDTGSGSLWGNISHHAAERDVRQTVSAFDASATFTNDFDQDTTVLTLGADLIEGGDGAWVLGSTIGYTRSKLDFDRSNADVDGANLGLYGSYRWGNAYLDGMVSHSWLQVDYDAPAISLSDIAPPEGDANSLSVRAEAGWELRLSDALRLEPLASLAWVRSSIDELDILSTTLRPELSNTVNADGQTSLRGGLGARLSLAQRLPSAHVNYAVSARVWEEFEGDTDTEVESNNPAATTAQTVSHTFDGTFGAVSASVSVSNPEGSLHGILHADAEVGDDYESLGIEVGVRYHW